MDLETKRETLLLVINCRDARPERPIMTINTNNTRAIIERTGRMPLNLADARTVRPYNKQQNNTETM